jgi:triosephosphate isomerase
MNKTIPETRDYLSAFIPAVRDIQDRDIVIFPPFCCLPEAATLLQGTQVALGAQNVFYEDKGAFTGEISPAMLVDAGCTYVITGHSERRQFFRETDEIVNRKIKAARKHDLSVIVCIGESLEERESSNTFSVLERELEKGLEGVAPENLVIAYEPIWAIGTGKTATTDQAQEAHAFIRKQLKKQYGNNGEDLGIIYGGSVTPENVDSLMACEDVDGALVGGASLKTESFERIVTFRKG